MRCLKTDEASQQTFEEVSQRLQTNLKNGLDWNEADSRLRICGYNEFHVKHDDPFWKKYIEQVRLFSFISHFISLYIVRFLNKI